LISVYPNPSEGTFSVIIPDAQKDAYITVSDLTGKVVANRAVSDNTGAPVVFNIGQVTKGMYIVQVKAGVYSTVVKLIVQ
jgi:hypothetical protein